MYKKVEYQTRDIKGLTVPGDGAVKHLFSQKLNWTPNEFIYLSKCIQTNKSGCPSNGGLLTQQQMLPVQIAYHSSLSLST